MGTLAPIAVLDIAVPAVARSPEPTSTDGAARLATARIERDLELRPKPAP